MDWFLYHEKRGIKNVSRVYSPEEAKSIHQTQNGQKKPVFQGFCPEWYDRFRYFPVD
jgi:hypothetical protein